MQKHKAEKILPKNLRVVIENLLEEIKYFTDLDSDYERQEELNKLTKYFKNDINMFLKQIFSDSDNDYYRGIVISELLRLNIILDKIDGSIMQDCIEKSIVIDLEKDNDYWEMFKEQSSYNSLDLTYMHMNCYELYINVDNFGDDISELVTVLKSLKKLGYIYVIVTEKEDISKDLKNSVCGVVKIK